jgi:hypothetical protein
MDDLTSFDHLVATLGLDPDEYENSTELKEWVRRNKEQKYVPTELLKCWGFTVDDAA